MTAHEEADAKTTWIHGMWYVENADGTGNWLGKLFRTDACWVFEYRFRYYKDNKTHDSADVRNWYAFRTGTVHADERDRMLKSITDTMVPVIEERFRSKADYVHLDCGPSDPKMLFELGSRPWAHIKKLEKGKAP